MRKILWATISVALISIVFEGCKEKEESIPKYNVQFVATEGGTIEGESGEYEEGEWLSFNAIPNDGYYFDQWCDGNVYSKSYLIVEKDTTITATFKKKTITTVDLGLESGNLWATCNLGAYRPWDYGDYYAWGETETKEMYGSSNYKYWIYSDVKWLDSLKLTKYCHKAKYGKDGFVDSLTTLQPEDDAATAVWGTEYSTPTVDDWAELVNQCYLVYTHDYYGHKGIIVFKAKSDSDKGARGENNKLIDTPSESYTLSDPHIFIPFAGWRERVKGALNSGCSGRYWSASLRGNPHQAYNFAFDDYYTGPRCYLDVKGYDEYRQRGFSIRPIRRK